ncbi:MAG: FixH family protein [Pseudomonadota bacterium]
MTSRPKRQFTGKHMLLTMVAGFGIVAAVNFYMASLAVGGFHGTVVDNSYVASQKFNTWIEEAEAMEALGWSTEAARDETGHLILTTEGVPESALISAELRRPIGVKQFASLTFAPLGDGRYRSLETLEQGRWTMRLAIEADGETWAQESAIQ